MRFYTTSSFSGIGKKSALRILEKNSNQLLDLIEFGEEPVLQMDSEYLICAIKFLCLSYDENFKSEDINSLRYSDEVIHEKRHFWGQTSSNG